ncbi:hypothetical protein [Halorubrum sp. JWXQ-INN 858]|uniref:DUF7285 family protein n=1 Tax=Halorubrum sp. JWXQ-INN 858 TaxID=2690782 RepID=UPI002AA2B10E|nr:hypothetical protein [Halorubrum sp. JWXQ-INN 858]
MAASERIAADGRAAVEPVAALIALVAVGAALGLYAGALADAAPDRERDLAGTTLDRVERDAAVGGVVDPSRLSVPAPDPYAGATAMLETRRGSWVARSGENAPDAIGRAAGDDIARATVTVRVAPGENARGTLSVAVRR